jgi:hypothetical protein
MILMGTSLLIVAGALKAFASMSWDEIGRAMTVFAGSMAIMVGALLLLDLLKKGKRVKVEGFFKSETYQKDGKDHHVIKLIATSLSEVEKQKKEEAA